MMTEAGDILGVIDVQPTFMPGGELPVADGDAVVPAINRLLADRFSRAFATLDWHPPNHVSFASTHGLAPFDKVTLPSGIDQALWPEHARAGSAGADLHPDVDTRNIEIVLRKGTRIDRDSYSAFHDNDRVSSTGLAEMLRSRNVTRIFFAGLATDFCVGWSAEDAARLGFQAIVIEDACRAIAMPTDAGTTLDAMRARWAAAGVGVTTMAAVLA